MCADLVCIVVAGKGLVCNADGFPRTALQVDFLKLLYDKMLELHIKHADGPEEWQYPRPSFKVYRLPPPYLGYCPCQCQWPLPP